MYDVIIVGGGVAGAAAAALLGKRGVRVLLCDRTRLPAPAVSTHFFGPSALSFLDGLGVLEKVLATGAPPLRRWHLEVEGGYYGAPMLPRNKHQYNLCVRRETLTGILLEAARENGVEVRPESAVHALTWQGDQLVGVEGTGWQEKAQVVVGADGRSSFVARQLGAETTFDGGTWRCTLHAYWRAVAPLPEPALELWHDGADILQVGPCDGDRWVVMLSVPVGDLARLQTAVTDTQCADATGYEQRLHFMPAMRARLQGAERVSPVYRSARLGNFHRRAAGPGWRLVGDAYCHKDPLFGAGIADSFAGARALTDTVTTAIVGDIDWPTAESEYAAAVDERIGKRMRSGLDGLHTRNPEPGERAWIRGILAHPGLALEMTQNCSRLFAALDPDRRKIWQQAADSAAELLGLPPATRLEDLPGQADLR